MSWAFARDVSLSIVPYTFNGLSGMLKHTQGGLPFSSFWVHIDNRFDMPVRTTFLTAGFCCIYGLLYIASTAAFNSIVTTAVLSLNITYAVPQAICAVQGRRKLPRRYLNLSKYGYICNIFSPCWVAVIGVFFCLPNEIPSEAGSMNYVCVVLGILSIVIFSLWFIQGKYFHGPSVDLEMLNMLREIN